MALLAAMVLEAESKSLKSGVLHLCWRLVMVKQERGGCSPHFHVKFVSRMLVKLDLLRVGCSATAWALAHWFSTWSLPKNCLEKKGGPAPPRIGFFQVGAWIVTISVNNIARISN